MPDTGRQECWHYTSDKLWWFSAGFQTLSYHSLPKAATIQWLTDVDINWKYTLDTQEYKGTIKIKMTITNSKSSANSKMNLHYAKFYCYPLLIFFAYLGVVSSYVHTYVWVDTWACLHENVCSSRPGVGVWYLVSSPFYFLFYLWR